MVTVTLFYESKWNPALLHCSGESEGAWKFVEFEPAAGPAASGWHRATLTNVCDDVEFVCCNFLRTLWDNPPDSRNYKITIDSSDAAYVLIQGKLTKLEGRPIALVTDLDGTLLGNAEYLKQFNEHWMRFHKWKGSILVYSTGRNLQSFLSVAADEGLLKPDYAICGVGTEIYTFESDPNPNNSHLCRLDVESWLREGVSPESFDADVQDMNTRFPTWCPTRYHAKLDRAWEQKMATSFDKHEAIRQIHRLLPDAIINGTAFHDPFRLSVSVQCGSELESATIELARTFTILLSGPYDWKYYDILPKTGGKRWSAEYVCHELHKLMPDQVLVCGDSGNDLDLFALDGVYGCCVGNAQSDLVEFLKGDIPSNPVTGLVIKTRALRPTAKVCFATLSCAGAILEALKHFELDTKR